MLYCSGACCCTRRICATGCSSCTCPGTECIRGTSLLATPSDLLRHLCRDVPWQPGERNLELELDELDWLTSRSRPSGSPRDDRGVVRVLVALRREVIVLVLRYADVQM